MGNSPTPLSSQSSKDVRMVLAVAAACGTRRSNACDPQTSGTNLQPVNQPVNQSHNQRRISMPTFITNCNPRSFPECRNRDIRLEPGRTRTNFFGDRTADLAYATEKAEPGTPLSSSVLGDSLRGHPPHYRRKKRYRTQSQLPMVAGHYSMLGAIVPRCGRRRRARAE